MKRKNAHKHTDTHLDVCKTDGFIFKHSGKKKVWLSYVNYFCMGRNNRNDFAKNIIIKNVHEMN